MSKNINSWRENNDVRLFNKSALKFQIVFKIILYTLFNTMITFPI